MGVKFNTKTGNWEAFYSKRHPITGKFLNSRHVFKTEAAAKKGEKALIVEISERVKALLQPRWPELADSYLKACKENGLTLKTIYNADKCLKAATLPKWKDRTVDSITTEEIRSLITVDYAHSSETHRKAILKFIRLAFEHGIACGWVHRNPSPKMKFKLGRKLTTVLTYEQTKYLLNKALECNWPWYPVVYCALMLGLRSGELFALRWQNVDFEVAQIKVTENYNNKDGVKCPKNGESRFLDVAPELLTFLKSLKLQTGETGFVLPRLQRWKKGEQARELRLFLQAIGLPVVRFHDLRATWCTLMLSRGVQAAKVMSMGGWSSIGVMDRYCRQSGIDIQGITSVLKLHDPNSDTGKVLQFELMRCDEV